ncbi:MAG: tRNA (guanosine(46)-N7)-methyltransferase TrmB [Rhizobiales bacterium]|nr:tRNA (guanosine(46)-N7)-methyltransferase TrmB [Hyphomicrobiales bacterium]
MADKQSTPVNQLYGRRKGPRLRAHQTRLVERLLPQLRVDPAEARTSQPQHLFAAGCNEVWLEIGFGGGEHLAWQASNNPDVGFIGCEPFINGIAKLLSTVEADKLTNVRILDGDARELLVCLDPGTLARIFLLYPDPWPKRRHNKRRFINQSTLAQIHSALKPGGLFRVASDIPDYIRWTLIELRRHGGFEWCAGGPQDWRSRPHDWPATRYEAKAVREGRTPCYLEFRRQP